MKRLLLTMLLLAVGAAALPLKAQETTPAQLQQEVDNLKAMIKAKQAKIDSLDVVLKKFPDIKELSDSLNKEYPKKVDIARQLNKKIGTLDETLDSLSKVFNTLGPKIDTLKNWNGKLETYKRTVAPLVKRQLSQMANDIDRIWLGKKYAETDTAKLREDLVLYEAFKDEDKGVGNAYAKLKTFSDDVTLYGRGVEAVNSRYEAQKVAALVQSMGTLAKKETHQVRKQEAEMVYDQLKDYKSIVRYFQKIVIKKIDDEILMNYSSKSKKDQEAAWKEIKQYLATGDGGMIGKELTKIPWIDRQYNLYIKLLETNPFGENAARETIMDIKP